MARQPRVSGCWCEEGASRSAHQGGLSEWDGGLGAEHVLLTGPARSPSFPSHLWTPIQTFTSYKELNLYRAICGVHGSRGYPTWYRGSLCVPGRPAEEAGPSYHLIPAHSISRLCRDNFFPFQIGAQSHLCLQCSIPWELWCRAAKAAPPCHRKPFSGSRWHGKWG